MVGLSWFGDEQRELISARPVDPVVPLAFLAKLHDVLESYIDGAVTESSLKVRLSLCSLGASVLGV